MNILLITGLKVLFLNQMPVEHWIAILLNNRKIYSLNDFTLRIDIFLQKYLIDLSEYDVIEGWRADDAFFSYITDFVSNTLSLENVRLALKFGDLGNQVFLKSKKAFDIIEYKNHYSASASKFLTSARNRDKNAKQKYYLMTRRAVGTLIEDIVGRENF